MAKAAVADQLKLLELQAFDTKLVQLGHRARTAAANPEIAELEAAMAVSQTELVAIGTEAEDTARQVKRAETDVEVVVTRIDRDQKRLDSGTGSAKDLTALQSELGSLAKRRSDLEDIELEAMERLEAVQAKAGDHGTSYQALAASLAELTSARDVDLARIQAEAAEVSREREAFAAGIDAGLLASYDKIRTDRGGVGAGALQQKRCGACRMELNPSDLAAIAKAAPDDVVRCEECGRILVRIPEPAQ